ncbi:centrin-3 isoform X3 [Ictalurus furcatus]|uniref:centrin-3 isoform X3 n=1 Tax=Ictalurus furcatus TaxID=66913 RepID=UPI0023501214|nr:centrin-3 isoform X3 [Ictalurus furcatus]
MFCFIIFGFASNGQNEPVVKVAMRALGFEVKKVDVMMIVKDFDRGGTGKITYEIFKEVVTDRILDRDPKEEVMKAFKLFDDDDSGKISLKNLRRVARELGEDISDEELRAMIDEFDTDGDGEINTSPKPWKHQENKESIMTVVPRGLPPNSGQRSMDWRATFSIECSFSTARCTSVAWHIPSLTRNSGLDA